MTRGATVRAWAGVHATGPALTVLTGVGLASTIFSQVQVTDLGVLVLVSPVSLLLLLPAAAGVAVAIAADNTARLPLPDPPRAVASRATWVLAWTSLAILLANLGQLSGAPLGWEPAVRNVLLHTAFGLATVRIGYPHLAWLPSLLYTLACMVFGYPPHGSGYYWWATVLESDVTSGQLITVGALFATALVGHVLPRYWRLRDRGGRA